MKRIFKYPFELGDDVTVWMPEGAKVVSVQVQREGVCFWAIVEPQAPEVQRRFSVRGTGHELGDVGEFIGTVQTHGGGFVWHIFEAA